MFRQLSKYFPDRASSNSSGSGQKARQKLNRALLFGALLLGLSIASPFILSTPRPPDTTPPISETDSSTPAAAPDRTPAPADPSPVDLSSPGVIIAVVLLAGGAGLALYLHNSSRTPSTGNGLITPIAEFQVSPQQKLQLIRCAGDVLLLAVSSDRIDLLKTYAPDTVPVNGDHAAARPREMKGSANGFDATPFAEILKNYSLPYSRRRHT